MVCARPSKSPAAQTPRGVGPSCPSPSYGDSRPGPDLPDPVAVGGSEHHRRRPRRSPGLRGGAASHGRPVMDYPSNNYRHRKRPPSSRDPSDSTATTEVVARSPWHEPKSTLAATAEAKPSAVPVDQLAPPARLPATYAPHSRLPVTEAATQARRHYRHGRATCSTSPRAAGLVAHVWSSREPCWYCRPCWQGCRSAPLAGDHA